MEADEDWKSVEMPSGAGASASAPSSSASAPPPAAASGPIEAPPSGQ